MEALTFYPFGDEPMLSFYNGAYDKAFIAFHPFYAIPGQHSRSYHSKTVHVERSELDADLSGSQLLAAVDGIAKKHRSGKLGPELVDTLAKREGLKIGWEQVGRGAGLSTFGAVNRALMTGIGALRTEWTDPVGASRLERYCDENALFMPAEGCFQAVMERSIARLFRDAEVDDVEAATEFDEAPQRLRPGALDGDTPWDVAGALSKCVKRLFAADRSLLVVVEWDSFVTLICGRAEKLQQVRMSELFDGFWCDASTSHVWWHEQPRAFELNGG